MVKDIEQALSVGNLKEALQLIKTLKATQPDHPWLGLYIARFHEARGKYIEADRLYRQLLPQTINPQMLTQIRKGISRIEELNRQSAAQLQEVIAQQKQAAIAAAKQQTGGTEVGVLVLQAIPDRDTKTQAAQNLARIMAIDPYNARLQIPHRSWRLYRIGAIGELEFYCQQLRQASIPCFTQTINQINSINVYEVKYLEQAGATVKVRCTDDQGIQGSFQFDITEISQRVEGLLPIFEEALQIDFTKRLQRYTRKTAILDYIRMGDLHLPDRQTILRFCDQNYDFHQGIPLGEDTQGPHQTNSLNWNNLLKLWSKLLPQVPLVNEFTPFGETAIEFPQSLAIVKPKLKLHRRESSLWDNAWQLYSSLAFYQS